MSEAVVQSYSHADLLTDSIPGISLDKAYKFLTGKSHKIILLGVIDSGMDIDHEDLSELVWTNSEDNSFNNQDDDDNGYVDDVHGWNFLGGKRGEAVYAQNELTREYNRYDKRFSKVLPESLSDQQKVEYDKYQALKQRYEAEYGQYKGMYDQYSGVVANMEAADKKIKEELKKETYTLEEVKALPDSPEKQAILNVLKTGVTIEQTKAQLYPAMAQLKELVEIKYNRNFHGRATHDDPFNISDVPYGNGYVKGDPNIESHATHVAGIIMASRNNNKGVQGVTNDVKLISARTIPKGDEYDKDVALAIRYMVDAGAKVINMSFGKSTSPNPEWVYDAMKYAASKDVLIVRAAGNDGRDIDVDDYRIYPNDAMDNKVEFTNNVITVGGSTRFFNEKLVGDFSNYGKLNVDIFAPGDHIYSSVPNNSYDYKNGTSMATPAVSGVAALIRAYYPGLSAPQVKQILMNSGTKVDMEVFVPKTKGKEKKNFSEMSVSGRLLNAYNAVRMADQVVNN